MVRETYSTGFINVPENRQGGTQFSLGCSLDFIVGNDSAWKSDLEQRDIEEMGGEGEEPEDDEDDYTDRLLKSSRHAANQADTMISEYELERQRRIQENNAFLRNLGLLGNAELKTSLYKTHHHLVDTYMHVTSDECSVSEMPSGERLYFIFVPHLEYDVDITVAYLDLYRQRIESLARSSLERLDEGGYFIVGVRDVRLSRPDATLVPMGLLVQDDLQSIPRLTLKEIIIVVPHGYTRSRSKISLSIADSEPSKFDGNFSNSSPIPIEEFTFETDFVEEQKESFSLPIVHTYYFLYVKRSVPGMEDK
jgi:hypothetical protein